MNIFVIIGIVCGIKLWSLVELEHLIKTGAVSGNIFLISGAVRGYKLPHKTMPFLTCLDLSRKASALIK